MTQASFQYRARDRAGTIARGVILAPTKQDAYRRLRAGGLTPVRIQAHRERSGPRLGRRRVTRQDIATFTYQLSVLLEARIPVVEALRSIAAQEKSEGLKRVLEEVAASVQSGRTITESMSPHRRLFGTVYIETLRAAETSGNLVKVLAHLAEAVEEDQEMRRVVRGAMMYPAAVVAAIALASAFLVTFVVPKFGRMFEARGVELPALTRTLLVVGEFVQAWWWALLAAGVAGGFAARKALRRGPARAALDRALHRVPVLNRLLVGLAVARFASVFGLSLRSGIGVIDSLEMSGRATGRPLLERDTRTLAEQVRGGGRLGEVLDACAYLPAFVKQLVRAGETSAELPRMCEIIARHYSRETRHLAKNAATIVEPVLIACLTLVVLVIALAVFLPMWDMVTAVGG